MDAQEIINFIREAPKKTPVKVYLKQKEAFETPGVRAFGAGDKILFGEWQDIAPILEANAGQTVQAQEINV